jgi:hypothetical protein
VKKINSVQEWLPFDEILNNGIIKLKDNSYVKIIKIIPINFNLKSNLEKEAILNSYKIFLKTCNFDIQILIQSNKEDLSNHISKIKIQEKKENKKINLLSEKYIKYIQEINIEKKSASKNFYILIKEKIQNKKINNYEKILIEKLNDNYFNIKECLSRCGNIVYEIDSKEQSENIIKSFLNTRKELFFI